MTLFGTWSKNTNGKITMDERILAIIVAIPWWRIRTTGWEFSKNFISVGLIE
jgi:hypothetical protein